jgi:hypothetical protein
MNISEKFMTAYKAAEKHWDVPLPHGRGSVTEPRTSVSGFSVFLRSL